MKLDELRTLTADVRSLALKVRKQRIALGRHARALDAPTVAKLLAPAARGKAMLDRKLEVRNALNPEIVAALQRYATLDDAARAELTSVDGSRARFYSE